MKNPSLKTIFVLTLTLGLPSLAMATPDARIFNFAGTYVPAGSCKVSGYKVGLVKITASHAYGNNNVSINMMPAAGVNTGFGDMPLFGKTYGEGSWRVNNSYNVTQSIQVKGNSLIAKDSEKGSTSLTLSAGGISVSANGIHCRLQRVGSAKNNEAEEKIQTAMVEEAQEPAAQTQEKAVEAPIIEETTL